MEPFIFNKLIDPNVLHDLYENDYPYIEKIFQIALAHLNEDLETLRISHAGNDLEGLRKGVHKIKPVFGFMGMTDIEEKCTLFEGMCNEYESTNDLTGQLNELMKAIQEGQTAAEVDHEKLIRHNKGNP